MAFETKITDTLNKKIWIIPLMFGFMCFFLVSAIIAVEVRGFGIMHYNAPSLDPKFAFSIGGELFSMLVAIMITISILPAYKRQSGYIRIFVTLLTIGCFALYLDTVQMIVDKLPEFAMFNKIVCVFVFIAETIFTFFFWIYIAILIINIIILIIIIIVIIHVFIIIWIKIIIVDFIII